MKAYLLIVDYNRYTHRPEFIREYSDYDTALACLSQRIHKKTFVRGRIFEVTYHKHNINHKKVFDYEGSIS